MPRSPYDVIVAGAGHAGCEAAAAAARLGCRTLLITMDMQKMAAMSCNPAIGGVAKGQIVREIDALGGLTGIVTDASSIQFRMLNRSKGPAMWSPRSQCDRALFSSNWRGALETLSGLDFWQDEVIDILTENEAVTGVKTRLGVEFLAKTVILTAGTFLNGLMHIGRVQIGGGRMADAASIGLTEKLKSLGFEAGRMKTGTPVRIDGRSVDFSQLEIQTGDDDFHQFSFINTGSKPRLPQLPCYIAYTNSEVHSLLTQGFADSPLYNGTIQSIGPRYCPSIETKLVTFPDKTSHHLFLEPEGVSTNEYYLNGFSSSLPLDVQLRALRAIKGFNEVKIFRPGYAIEYDYFPPTQLHPTLETKLIRNLFFAGQINGTTGYEEAAAQGIMAGINAALKVKDSAPFVLQRDEAYIGVLIDDLVTKGVDEPYRMFTSRAEFRILLRQDDADVRLTPKAIELGMATPERILLFTRKLQKINELIQYSKTLSITPERSLQMLTEVESSPLIHAVRLSELINRPQLSFSTFLPYFPELNAFIREQEISEEEIETTEIRLKYAGYIDRERDLADKVQRLDSLVLGDKFNYLEINQLSIEARQKLDRIRPQTVGQASRIPGVSPADISTLLVMLGR